MTDFTRAHGLLLCLLFILSSKDIFGQPENVEIIVEPRIDSLILSQEDFNGRIKGYRIQLTSEKTKEAIDAARNQFSSLHPKVTTYIIYTAPNFLLKAGDFENKADAIEFHKQLKTFRYSFITEELIQYPQK